MPTLNEFSVDDTLPLDPQGYGSDVWFENYLDACGVYYERGPIRAFPYDCGGVLHLLSAGSLRSS